MSQTLLVASDHAGYGLKEALKKAMPQIQWDDLGPHSADRVDYPDFAAALGKKLKPGQLGLLICGSGIGMSMAANKLPGIRAALVENPVSARLSREHNDANVLCLGSRFVAPEYAQEILEAWLQASFQGGRHGERVKKIDQMNGTP